MQVKYFTYRVTDPETGEFYLGRGSYRTAPRSDSTGYKGSGCWVQEHPDRRRLRRTFLAFHANVDEAHIAERQLIKQHLKDPLCRNGEALAWRVEYYRVDRLWRLYRRAWLPNSSGHEAKRKILHRNLLILQEFKRRYPDWQNLPPVSCRPMYTRALTMPYAVYTGHRNRYAESHQSSPG
jgi:hypothetical protein